MMQAVSKQRRMANRRAELDGGRLAGDSAGDDAYFSSVLELAHRGDGAEIKLRALPRSQANEDAQPQKLNLKGWDALRNPNYNPNPNPNPSAQHATGVQARGSAAAIGGGGGVVGGGVGGMVGLTKCAAADDMPVDHGSGLLARMDREGTSGLAAAEGESEDLAI